MTNRSICCHRIVKRVYVIDILIGVLFIAVLYITVTNPSIFVVSNENSANQIRYGENVEEICDNILRPCKYKEGPYVHGVLRDTSYASGNEVRLLGASDVKKQLLSKNRKNRIQIFADRLKSKTAHDIVLWDDIMNWYIPDPADPIGYSDLMFNFKSVANLLKWKKEFFLQPCRDHRLYSFCQQHYLIFYNSNTQLFSQYRPFPPNMYTTSYNITYTTHSTINRVNYMPDILSLWRGPLSIALFIGMDELALMDDFLVKYGRHPNLFLTIYIHLFDVRNKEDNYVISERNGVLEKEWYAFPLYPINVLRNLAILQTRTTHYIVMDMDFWPSDMVYDQFFKIPESILSKENSAIILPAFQFASQIRDTCDGDALCFEHNYNLIPKTKAELLKLYRKSLCNLMTPKTTLHSYLWWEYYKDDLRPDRVIVSVPCMNFSRMEPYLILKRTDISPLFHPYYINYGYNKVSYISRLRYEGYHFHVLMQVFGFDQLHPKSNMSVLFRNSFKNKDMSYNRMNAIITSAFVEDAGTFPICPWNRKLQRRKYFI